MKATVRFCATKQLRRHVLRMRRLAETESIPVLGSVLNMAYIQDGATRSHPFGKPGRRAVGEKLSSAVLVEIPLVPSVNSGNLRDILNGRNDVSRAFEELALRVAGYGPKKAAAGI